MNEIIYHFTNEVLRSMKTTSTLKLQLCMFNLTSEDVFSLQLTHSKTKQQQKQLPLPDTAANRTTTTLCYYVILKPQNNTGQRIRSTRDKCMYLSQNPVENYTRSNDRCYCVPESHTDQYRHSYFPKTIVEWNHLDDTIIHQKSADRFKLALVKARSQ